MRLRSPRWDEVVYWALDLETSGLSPRRHRILSVGMVPLRGGAIHWGERFYSLVHPVSFEGLAEPAIAVHQILPEELRSAPQAGEVLPEVARRLAEGALLVHHAPLDVAFLRRAFRHAGLAWPRPPVVDTQRLLGRLAARLHRLDPYGRPPPRILSEIRADLGLPSYDDHHALADALATAELFLALRARLDLTRLRQLT